jgi:hypothetical protein
MFPNKFLFIWPSGFRDEDIFLIKNMVDMGNSCFWLNFKKNSHLKLGGTANCFFVEWCIYGRYCIQFSYFVLIPKYPNGKTQCPGIRYVILIQTFSENGLRNDDFIVILVLFHIVTIVCENIKTWWPVFVKIVQVVRKIQIHFVHKECISDFLHEKPFLPEMW